MSEPNLEIFNKNILRSIGFSSMIVVEKMSNWKHHDYIELVERFQWLLDDEFQNLIKDFDWDTLTASECDKVPGPMRRIYPGSDKWECDYCKLSGGLSFN